MDNDRRYRAERFVDLSVVAVVTTPALLLGASARRIGQSAVLDASGADPTPYGIPATYR